MGTPLCPEELQRFDRIQVTQAAAVAAPVLQHVGDDVFDDDLVRNRWPCPAQR
jgi:hypothetical protein